jgi:hypothetical protein
MVEYTVTKQTRNRHRSPLPFHNRSLDICGPFLEVAQGDIF